jgi:hypothetical protein
MDYDENMGSWNHSAWLDVTKTRQDFFKKLLSIKDNYHLVRINLRDLNQCSNVKNLCVEPWITTLSIKTL